MVTTIRKLTGGNHPFYEFACLSTDTKPTSLVPENSLCREIDTGKRFYFSGGTWHEAPARGGSSEDGGLPDNFPAEGSANANKFLGFDNSGDYAALDAPSGAERFVVTLTTDGTMESATSDKTYAELVAANEAGKYIVADITVSVGGTSMLVATVPLDMIQFIDGRYEYCFTTEDEGYGGYKFIVGVNDEDETGVTIYPYQLGSSNEKFVVTMTDNAGVTSNKTVAEILAAKAAGKEVVAHVTSSAYLDQVVELPLMWSIADEEGSAVFFSVCAPMIGQTVTEMAYSVYCLAQTGQEEVWGSDFVELGEGVPSYSSSNNGQVLGVSSNNLAWVDNYAPLIVTMTEDEQNPGTYVGDKTYGEALSAFTAGKTVRCNIMNGDAIGYSVDCLSIAEESGTVTLIVLLDSTVSMSGSSSDYISTALN